MKQQSSSTSTAFPALPMPIGDALLATFRKPAGILSRAWKWFRDRQMAHSTTRRLHVAATASLGEKRFVAVVEMDGQQFLVGGGAANVVLLAELSPKRPFNDVLQETMSDQAEEPVSCSDPLPLMAVGSPEQVVPIASASKSVRPAIEQFVKPVAKKPSKKADAPLAAMPLKVTRRVTATKGTKAEVLPAAKPRKSNTVSTKPLPRVASSENARHQSKPVANAGMKQAAAQTRKRA